MSKKRNKRKLTLTNPKNNNFKFHLTIPCLDYPLENCYIITLLITYSYCVIQKKLYLLINPSKKLNNNES